MKLNLDSYSDEVIDHDVLSALGVLANANGRSVVEQLNIAVSNHVLAELPAMIGNEGMSLLFGADYERQLDPLGTNDATQQPLFQQLR